MPPSRHRALMVTLALAFVALVALVVVFYPTGDHAELPAPLESVYPAPGDAVAAQVEIVIELPPGYEVSLIVDGMPIPPAEVYAVEATGTIRWRPGPASVVSGFIPGRHTIEVSWDRRPGAIPDPGAFAWTFWVT